MGRPAVIAHRGASAVAPENTMCAFRKALQLGADALELDVHLTRDGQVVVIHDEDIRRTSNGKGLVKDFTLEQLRQYDFGSWFSSEYRNEPIPTLEEVLALLAERKEWINIELKNGTFRYEGLEQKVWNLVKQYGMEERTVISSFNHYSLLEMKRIAPDIRTGPLYVAGLVNAWEYATKLGAYAIHPQFYSVVPEIVQECKAHGVAIHAFTVDDEPMIAYMGRLQIEGVITNVPDKALRILNEME